ASNGTYQVTVKQLATATRVTSSSPDGGTTAAAIGNAVNQTVPLSSAGFGTPITTGTFTINGKQITIDANTVLNDPTNPDSIVSMINNAGAGVTASIVNDAYGRPNEIQLTSAPGQSIQLGNSTDTSNFLSAVGLTGAAIVGNTATTVTGSPVAAGALSASITVDGTTVAINQTNSGNTGTQNAAYIVQQLNAAGLDVTAAATGTNSDQIQLTQNTLGSQQTISVSVAGTNASSVGLTNGTYQNGTDKVVTPAPLGELDPTQSLSTQNFATPLAPVSGGGTIDINGTQINWSSSDSLNDVITRINSSGAGVTASYDSLTDRVSLSNSQTGGGAISLQDVSGNLLQSLHLTTSTGASVPQQLGQNAIVNISGVNNGQDISSSSNTLNNVIPGVDLNLLQQSSTPVTLTIGQDTTTTVNAVQNFVSAVNTFFGDINTDTATSSNPSQQGVLTADPSIQGIESTLESLITSPVVGGTPGYNTLSSVGKRRHHARV
ncbi:MAG: flagellar filament capping protein FliD, partial [Chloroflexi bacterium]|nr:flagellar filament capping protein FliD [Chloroflexota bacterium]